MMMCSFHQLTLVLLLVGPTAGATSLRRRRTREEGSTVASKNTTTSISETSAIRRTITTTTEYMEYPSFSSKGNLLWSDDFTGNDLNKEYWVHDDGALIKAGKVDSSEEDLRYYVKNTVRVENGHLIITAKEHDNLGILSGRIKTQDRVLFQYGTIEARIKVTGTPVGLSPRFWTQAVANSAPSLASGKIDIFRATPGDKEGDDTTIRGISGAQWKGTNGMLEDFYETDYETDLMNGDYHVYKLDWTPRQLSVYVDDMLVWAMDISDANCQSCEVFHRPHFMLLSLAVLFSDHDNYSHYQDKHYISEMQIDYVRLFNNGFSIANILYPTN